MKVEESMEVKKRDLALLRAARWRTNFKELNAGGGYYNARTNPQV
jgi:hypothetical protein